VQPRRSWCLGGVMLAMMLVPAGVCPQGALGQETAIVRKVKTRVSPDYPELARRSNIGGRVRLVVVVAPNGSVKSTKALGGHPLLIGAAQDAVKKWKFESAGEESSGVVEVEFKPHN